MIHQHRPHLTGAVARGRVGIVADRVGAEDRTLQLERASGEVLTPFEIDGGAVVLPETKLRRIVLPKTDARARAGAVRRAALQLAHDVEGRGQSREARRACEERAQLRLLPSPPHDRWRREAEVIRDARAKTQQLPECQQHGAVLRAREGSEAGDEDVRAQEDRAERDRLHATPGHSTRAAGRSDEGHRAVDRNDEEVQDDVEQHGRRQRRSAREGRHDPGREAELGRALDPAAHVSEVVDEPQQDVRHGHEDPDLERRQPRWRRGPRGRSDPRSKDDGRDRTEEECDVRVRPCRLANGTLQDAGEDDHVDDLGHRGEELEGVQGR